MSVYGACCRPKRAQCVLTHTVSGDYRDETNSQSVAGYENTLTVKECLLYANNSSKQKLHVQGCLWELVMPRTGAGSFSEGHIGLSYWSNWVTKPEKTLHSVDLWCHMLMTGSGYGSNGLNHASVLSCVSVTSCCWWLCNNASFQRSLIWVLCIHTVCIVAEQVYPFMGISSTHHLSLFPGTWQLTSFSCPAQFPDV